MALVQGTTFTIMVICLLMAATKKLKWEEVSVYEDAYSYSLFFIVSFAAVLIFVEGFRYGYQDTVNYKGMFQYLSGDLPELLHSSNEPGYILIEWLLRKISTHPQFIIIVVALFFNIADVGFIRKYSNNLPISLFFYFLFSFLGNCNGLRQLIAATFLMLAFPWVVDKKYIRYILLILMLSTIHRSILVMIPLMFAFGGKRWNWGIAGIVFVCAFSAIVPGPMNALVGSLIMDDYSHYIGLYVGANIINVLIEGVPFALGVIYHLNNRDNINENRAMDILINMQAIRFSFMMLATGMAQYARIGMYMKNVSAIVVPFLISQVFRGDSQKMIRIVAIILYFVVFFVENSMLNARGAFDVFYLDFSIFS